MNDRAVSYSELKNYANDDIIQMYEVRGSKTLFNRENHLVEAVFHLILLDLTEALPFFEFNVVLFDDEFKLYFLS